MLIKSDCWCDTYDDDDYNNRVCLIVYTKNYQCSKLLILKLDFDRPDVLDRGSEYRR